MCPSSHRPPIECDLAPPLSALELERGPFVNASYIARVQMGREFQRVDDGPEVMHNVEKEWCLP